MTHGPDPGPGPDHPRSEPGPGQGPGPGDPVDAAVRDALRPRPVAAEVAGLAEGREAIASAELRPGLVKTFPPQVELVVTPADGGPDRVFDLVEELDGRLSLGRAHPPAEAASERGPAAPDDAG